MGLVSQLTPQQQNSVLECLWRSTIVLYYTDQSVRQQGRTRQVVPHGSAASRSSSAWHLSRPDLTASL